MKDYANNSKKTNKKTKCFFKKNASSFLGKLFFIIKFLLSSVFFLVAVAVIVWIFFSESFQEKNNLIFIYDIKCFNSNIGEIYYASYQPASKKISTYRVKEDHQFVWPNSQQGIMETASFSEYVAEIRDENHNTVLVYPWIIDQLADEVMVVEKTEDCLLLEEGSDVTNSLKKISTRLIWSREELTFLEKVQRWIGFSFADWEEIKVFSQPIKSSDSVLTQCSIAILNSTDISGYAQGLSMILENSGFRVIRIDTFENKNKINTVASVDKPECEKYANLLARKLFDWVEILEDENSDKLTSKYRADIVITLGQLQ